MATASFGGATTTTSYTDNYAQSSIGLAGGVVLLNGTRPIRIVQLGVYCNGRGATRAFTLTLGGASVGVSRGSASSAGYTGLLTTGAWQTTATTATLTIDGNGSFYFGRGGGGSTVDSYGSSWTGALGGVYGYYTGPTAPSNLVVNQSAPDQADLTWDTPTGNGGTALTGYAVQYAENATFTTGLVTTTFGVVNSGTVTGLVAGKTYFWRVCARNVVSTSAGTYGPASAYVQSQALSGVYVGDGSAWVASGVKNSDGTNWRTPEVLISDGTAWNPGI